MVEFDKSHLDRFFAALTRRDLPSCEMILSELSTLVPNRPEVAAWCDYFAAILVQERDNNFAEAARRYRFLLQVTAAFPFLHGQVLISLSGALLLIGNYREAVQVATAAVDHFHHQGDWREEAKACAQLGLMYHMGYNAGDFSAPVLQQGLTACQKALTLLDQAPDQAPDQGDSSSHVAVLAWNTLGLLYTNLLDWANATLAYQQLLAICERTQNLFGASIAQSNLGLAYRLGDQSQWQQAESALLSAQAGFQALVRPYEELTALTQLALLYADMQCTESMHDAFTQALHLVEAIRASNSTEEARAGFLASVMDLLANAVLCYVHIGDFARAFACMEQARARSFLDLLTLGAPDLTPDLAEATLSLAQVQEALPPDALLLIYFTTGLIEAPDRFTPTTIVAERPGFPRATTLIFAVTRTVLSVHDVALSPNDLYPVDLATPVEDYFLDPVMRQNLYDLLIAPIAHHLPGQKTLFLVPHGPLHYVPFQALLTPTGEALLQPEGPCVVYTPSASILLRQPKARIHSNTDSEQPARNAGCLAIGCNHASSDATTPVHGPTLVDLRYAEDEAVTIARLTNGDALVGSQPKKAQMLARAAHYRWLHFSCHGHFDPVAPLASALYIGEDEILTAQEIFQDLKVSTELVTLSACASGLSQVRRGDELYGLVRAFLYAGAAALVVTQWRVDERSTHLLMCKFYAQLMQSDDYATALHRAQCYLRALTVREATSVLADMLDANATKSPLFRSELVVLQQDLHTQPPDSTPFADPYFWAPFILIRG